MIGGSDSKESACNTEDWERRDYPSKWGWGAREARIKKVKVEKISIISTRASLVAQTVKNLPAMQIPRFDP